MSQSSAAHGCPEPPLDDGIIARIAREIQEADHRLANAVFQLENTVRRTIGYESEERTHGVLVDDATSLAGVQNELLSLNEHIDQLVAVALRLGNL